MLRPAWSTRLRPAGRAIGRFLDAHGMKVLHGPFAGLEYPRAARGHVDFLAAKVLGSYELELDEAIERILAGGSPPRIVDVGAGEGYYVVGLARRTGGRVPVIGFELNGGERRICHQMAALNDVDERVALDGFCGPAELREALVPGALLVCDCEGFEAELLDPGLVPDLARTTIIVELHPHVVSGIEAMLLDRFASTHRIDPIPLRGRDARRWPELTSTPSRDAFLILSEGWLSEAERRSSGRSWLVMEPRLEPDGLEPAPVPIPPTTIPRP